MKVEIWSDVMCPFCYIGKRRFEAALQQFEHRAQVQIEWKSFQLDPDIDGTINKSVNEYLAERKGVSVQEAEQLNQRVSAMAADAGLEFNFSTAKVANSFDAHRLSHLAKRRDKQHELEELLFRAYFTEGKKISDHAVLTELGTQAGLDPEEIKRMLEGAEFSDDVKRDVYEAGQVGARGVPFFILGSKYAVSGAQETGTFLGALQQTWQEV